MGIKDGKNKSLFFGEAVVHCEAFKDVKDVTKFDTYYLDVYKRQGGIPYPDQRLGR